MSLTAQSNNQFNEGWVLGDTAYLLKKPQIKE